MTRVDRLLRWRRQLPADRALRRRAGSVLVGVAVAGVVSAVAGTVVAWRLTGAVNDATTESLTITIDTLDTLEDTLGVAEEVVTDTADALVAVESNLRALDESVSAGTTVASDASDLTGAAAPALDDIAATLRRLESLGTGIDRLLVTVSNLPLAPDYDPEEGLGVTFRELADSVEPLPAAFDASSSSLARFETSLSGIDRELDELTGAVADVNEGLSASRGLLDDYRVNVAQARAVAAETAAELDGDQTVLRLLILLGGLNFALVQIVPLWLGLGLLDSDGDDREVTG